MIIVDVLDLGSVTLPDWHPRAVDGTCAIRAAVVRHPDGAILFDTGVADDHPVIEEMFAPDTVGVVDALASVGIDERDVVAIVNSHLHFDHCGQNRVLANVPVWVQRTEYALVDEPHFTVPEWARLTPDRRRLIDGDEALADGIRIVATPGHTPGHQSLVIDDGERRTVLGGQCCFTCHEFEDGATLVADVHDETWHPVAIDSLRRLRELDPDVVHLAHDATIWRRP